MILLDKPYVSEYLKETIIRNQFPVLNTEYAKALNLPASLLVNPEEASQLCQEKRLTKLYTSSENSLGWVIQNASNPVLKDSISAFKDKVRFRELLKPLFPDFYFQAVQTEELGSLDTDKIPFPIILKPAIGFFSMGVYLVESKARWEEVLKLVAEELTEIQGLYPEEVMGAGMFILEEVIEGREFAVDAYYDQEGNPVITNILEHLFASGDDVSDRVYFTSAELVREFLQPFSKFLSDVGELTGAKNFPVHLEVRMDDKGNLQPIEINPMRFGGWCTTADLAWHAYGLNAYEYYFQSIKPDWDLLLEGKENKVFALVVLNNSTGYTAEQIQSFDVAALKKRFEKPLEYREINYHEYPVFGFLFTETRSDNMQELEEILTSSLKEYVTLMEG